MITATNPLVTLPGQKPITGTSNPVQDRYVGDLLNLMGAQYCLYKPKSPELEETRFASPELARLADNVLRDTVEGVKLVLSADPDQVIAPLPTNPKARYWPDTHLAMASMVATLPGVSDYSFSGMRNEDLYFKVDSQERADHLSKLVNDTLAGATVHWVPPRAPRP